jgi:ribulose-5-phosphate 4-epimerase/fuculose-1-phosphate aldolase
MSKTEKELRQDIVRVGELVFQKGWVAANDGNISIRLDENRILCTPTATSKGMLHVDDLIICDMQGNKIEGRKERHLGDRHAPADLQHAAGHQERGACASAGATGFATAGGH